MSAEQRLDRLLPGLTAQERALLMLRDFKKDKPQDRQLLDSAPAKQTPELNRMIGLMNAANGDIAHVIAVLRERALKEELRFSWLAWARICALEMWGVRAHFLTTAREAITESDYRKREEADRSEMIPIAECVELYTEYHHPWGAADYEPGEDGEPCPTDEAWYRVRDAKLAEMRGAIASGALPSKGKGKRLKIACGDFFDWIGEPVTVAPEVGIEFDVQPDHREREVARARRDHEFIVGLLDRGACKLDLPLDTESPLVMEPPKGFNVELARVLAVTIRAGVRENWQELRAIEEQVNTITAEFEGEDVFHPRVRTNFDQAKSALVDLHGQLQEYTGPFELPEPDEEIRAIAQRIVDNEVKHVPTR